MPRIVKLVLFLRKDLAPIGLSSELLPGMAVFEAATIIRAAPWFTVSIFVWSVLSGLLGGKHGFFCVHYTVIAGRVSA